MPLTQSLVTNPFSRIRLNSFLYMSTNICLVHMMFSFKISSTPLDLFNFNNLIAVLISLSLIRSSRASFENRNGSLFQGLVYQSIFL